MNKLGNYLFHFCIFNLPTSKVELQNEGHIATKSHGHGHTSNYIKSDTTAPVFYRVQVAAMPPCINSGPFRSAGDKDRFAALITTNAAILLFLRWPGSA